jgi:hypothetical protein
LAYNSGSGAFSIQVATGSQNGYLSSTDWTTFNSKQPAGNYVTTDTTQTITALKTFTAKVVINTGGTDDQIQLVGTAPSVRLTNAATGATINGFVAMSGGANNYIQGSVSGDMTIGNQNNGKILFGFGSGTATQKMSLDSSGNAVLGGGLTLGSTLSNGTYTYTLPGATGTLALISDVQTGYVPYTGATGAVNLGAYDLTVNGVIVGKGAGTGANNVILGDNALSANTTGSRNVAIGTFPLWKNTTGFGSIAIGAEALINQTTGNLNIAIGDNTAKYITTGVGNIAIGAGSGLDNLTTGSYNTILGGSLGSSIGNVSNNIILADGQGNIRFQWDGTNVKLNGNNAITQSGTITTNYLPKFTGTSTIGNSLVYDNGTNILIGKTTSTGGLVQISNGTNMYNFDYDASGPYFTTVNNANTVYKRFTLDASELYFNITASTKMVLTNSGNLGLGVTPSAWGNNLFAFQTQGGAVWSFSSAYMDIWQNSYYNGTSSIYQTTAAASFYRQSAGNHEWNIAPSGTAGATISWTQAMTLDASGRLGIGTSSPSNKLDILSAVSATPITNGVIRIVGTGTNPATGAGGGILLAQQNSAGSYINYASITGRRVNNAANDIVDLDFNTGSPSDAVPLATRMTITGNAGNVGIGTTSPSQKLDVNGKIRATDDLILAQTNPVIAYDNGTTGALRFASDGGNTERMRITSGGNVGIGTSSPNSYTGFTNLQVNGSSNGLVQVTGSSATTGSFYGGGGFVYVGSTSAHPFVLFTADVERIRLKSNGVINFSNVPSSSAGLSSGDIYKSAGVLMIV